MEVCALLVVVQVFLVVALPASSAGRKENHVVFQALLPVVEIYSVGVTSVRRVGVGETSAEVPTMLHVVKGGTAMRFLAASLFGGKRQVWRSKQS